MARKDAAIATQVLSKHNTRRWMLLAIATAVVGTAVMMRVMTGDMPASAQRAASGPLVEKTSPTQPESPQHDVMAIVNGQDISRPQLAHACVERFGEQVLESLVNKRLIQHHCRNRGVTISAAHIEAEIDRMAKRFKLGREQWLELLQKERNVSAEEYKRDILWPTLALRRLAENELTVSPEELKKAYETRYGPAVQVRLIVVADERRAQQLQKQLTGNPDDFPRVAMQESIDVNSASIGGLIQPIRMHVGDTVLERTAFNLQAGQVSPVISIGEQFALLKCESRIPPRNVPIEQAKAELEERIKEDKLRVVANEQFAELQKSATVKNVYNNDQLRAAMPGVAATVNGERITMRQLGEECLARHGQSVLKGEISKLLLQQELERTNLEVTQADLEEEMAHAAQLAGVVGKSGAPDLAQWRKVATEEQGVSYDVYLRDSVWPSAALKKLTSSEVEVTQDDLQKGYEANYGERVRCRAIVLGKMRRAQEVWSKARDNPSLEFFGDLAQEYSVEPTSKTLRGEVPPLRRHGGQPQLEEVAFQLSPGQLSGIIQVGDKFVLLKCEGRTEPIEVKAEEVREILHQDIYEKKLRIAMAGRFDKFRKNARIDNYLAGTSQAPINRQATVRKRDPAVRQASGAR